MTELPKCAECGASIPEENATFCSKCHTCLSGAKTRWFMPE